MTMPPERFVLMQSWWLATCLVRRHPELTLIETHPGGGMYDCLTLIREQKTVIDINRVGSIHAAGGQGAPLQEMFEPGAAVDLVEKLERAAGLHPPPRTPPSTPQVLTFRTITQLLTITLNTGQAWDVRSVFNDSSGGMGSAIKEEYLEPFPIAAKRAEQRQPDDLLGVPYYRYWAALRDGEPVAILDRDGYVYVGDQVHFLPTLYNSHARRLTPTVAAALAPVLP